MKNKKSSPQPNLKLRDGQHPRTLISNGDHSFVLPKNQAKPFYHAHAKKIARMYPAIYEYLGSSCLNC